jgi:hypothetical protein
MAVAPKANAKLIIDTYIEVLFFVLSWLGIMNTIK